MLLGLSSFKDHPALFLDEKSTLFDYGKHLGLIELDTVFYGIPKQQTVLNWQSQVPESFIFLVKAYGGMTLQKDWQSTYATEEKMYEAFIESFTPLKAKNQLGAVLFQFPQSFLFSREAGHYLQKIRRFLPDWPLAVEFRHGSWFQRENIKKTLGLLQALEITLVAADEPQVSYFPVPFFIFPTHSQFLYLRLHGRNLAGWVSGEKRLRTLYDYSPTELLDLQKKVQEKKEKFQEIYVIFNNNAGYHAVKNLREFQKLFPDEKEKPTLNPKQLDLF